MYNVFTRNWWKNNDNWPNGLEPDPSARRHHLDCGLSEDEAQAMCREWNRTHPPGRLSRKAEYEEAR